MSETVTVAEYWDKYDCATILGVFATPAQATAALRRHQASEEDEDSYVPDYYGYSTYVVGETYDLLSDPEIVIVADNTERNERLLRRRMDEMFDERNELVEEDE